MSSKVIVLAAFLSMQLAFSAQSVIDHSIFTAVLRKHVVHAAVDYPAIKQDKRFAEYLKMISAVKPESIRAGGERLAFWINAYNAFTIKLVVDNYPVKSIRDIKQGKLGPWDIVWIEIGGRKYSLNQIEHEIIRKEFDEPRIHMALVCAARSCPPLRSEAYNGAALEGQLHENSKAFILDTTKNYYDRETRTLHISELFNWYGSDFNKKYGSAQGFVLKMLGIPDVKPVTTKYVSYDWSLNSDR